MIEMLSTILAICMHTAHALKIECFVQFSIESLLLITTFHGFNDFPKVINFHQKLLQPQEQQTVFAHKLTLEFIIKNYINV